MIPALCRLFILLILPALAGCGTTSHLVDISYMGDYPIEPLEAPNPSLEGPLKYRTYFYGSGDDKRRKEYAGGVDFKTEPVDGNPFVDYFDNMPRYWGFGFDKLPLNGRVWFPEGPGPFPLVLIVHGNHAMKDFSDPGYEYLGTLLASRGFIAVSVDENFLNHKFWGENDARAFVLLEHLKVWKEWNQTEGHTFEGKVDMDRIALIGHSRGGESVAHAAAFNKLSRYPDDAKVMLGYNFAIQSVIAIAPCDGQYKPAGHPTALENINYLVIHGGHDADVNTFMGLSQFKRVHFTDGRFRFKSAVYIYRANHSRFNTAWGRLDADPPEGWFINDRPIMPAEEQRQVAKVLISAFLEATLNSRNEYLPVFKDTRHASHWLPEDIYVNQYQDSNFQVIADFEEDFDVTTTTIRGGELMGDNLTTWKESHVTFRTKGKASQDNSVVILWGEEENDDNDDPNSTKIGTYHITLGPETHRGLHVDNDSKLVLSIGSVNPQQDTLIDLTIELRDSDGNRAALPLSTVGPVHPALNVRYIKVKWIEKKHIEDYSERLLQTYEIPFRQFVEANSSFDPSKLENIRFVFDRFPNGTIMLDDVGISR
jgi:dienelactone hydrolase